MIAVFSVEVSLKIYQSLSSGTNFLSLQSKSGDVPQECLAMPENAGMTRILEDTCYVCVIAPRDDSHIGQVLRKQVSRPANVALAPSCDPVAA